MDQQKHDLLAEWYRRTVLSSQGHYNTAQRLGRLNWLLGIPVACLSGLVGAAVFATLQKEVGAEYRIILGMVSVLAAVLASLQTFLGFAERAEDHRRFGARYGTLRREIETILARDAIPASEFDTILGNLLQRMDAFGEEAPQIPSKVWVKTEARYSKRLKVRFPFSEREVSNREHRLQASGDVANTPPSGTKPR